MRAKEDRIDRPYRFDTARQITKHAQASEQGNTAIFDFEEQTILAQRAAEDVLELLAAEKTKSADLLPANKELENRIGQLLVEFDISSDKKVGLHEEVTKAHRDLEVTDENGQLWQTVLEKAPRRTLTRGAGGDNGPCFG